MKLFLVYFEYLSVFFERIFLAIVIFFVILLKSTYRHFFLFPYLTSLFLTQFFTLYIFFLYDLFSPL